jgi:photosystem II stability/assembly factor-like uncharacterized protein
VGLGGGSFGRRRSIFAVGIILIGSIVAACSTASSSRRYIVARPAPTFLGRGQLTGNGTLVIGSIHMITPTVGWAFGGEGNDEAILRTTDGTSSWTDVTPVHLPHSFSLSDYIDANNAWLGIPGLAGGRRTLTVYRTHDAGKTWAAGESIVLPTRYPDTAPLYPGMQFVDLEHGWVTLGFPGADPASTGVAVWGTADGGQGWKLLSESISGLGTSSPGALPLGCAKTGMTFNSPTTGWATAHCADGTLFFYVTHDGGRSWHPQPLPPPAGYPANLFGNCDCGSLPPRFGGTSRDGTLIFASPSLLYVTHDGGTTWKAVTLPTKYIGESDFIDASNGWLISLTPDPLTHGLAFDRLYLTHDGGQSWLPVKPDRSLTGRLRFVNPQVGWFIDHRPDTPQLYRTTDGGLSWQHIEPRLVGRPAQSA